MIRLRSFSRGTVTATVLSATVLLANPGFAAEATSSSSRPSLQLLFELELATEGEIRPYVEAPGPLDRSFSMSRDLVAQGEGRTTGQWLEGAFGWSLLARRYPSSSFGRVHLTGWLETDDGAEIFLRATGYSHEDGAQMSATTLLTLTGGFEVELEPDYDWLNGIVALIEGRLDPETNTFHYQAWVLSEALARRAPRG